MKEKNRKIQYNKKLSLEELSKLISVDKEEILNNSEFLDFKIDENKKLNFTELNKIARIYDYEFFKHKKSKSILMIYIIILLALSTTTTFSVITYINTLSKNNNTKTDKKANDLNINMISENETEIKLENTFPMSDEKAKELKPYIFTINNLGTLDAQYRISIADYSLDYGEEYSSYQRLDYKYIKYSIECENEEILNKTGLLSDLNKIDSNKLVLITSKLKKGIKNKKFSLRIWVDSNADNEAANKYFVGKVLLEGDRDTYGK